MVPGAAERDRPAERWPVRASPHSCHGWRSLLYWQVGVYLRIPPSLCNVVVNVADPGSWFFPSRIQQPQKMRGKIFFSHLFFVVKTFTKWDIILFLNKSRKKLNQWHRTEVFFTRKIIAKFSEICAKEDLWSGNKPIGNPDPAKIAPDPGSATLVVVLGLEPFITTRLFFINIRAGYSREMKTITVL